MPHRIRPAVVPLVAAALLVLAGAAQAQTPQPSPPRQWRRFSLWLEAGYAGASVREAIASANKFSPRGHGFELGAGVRVFEVLSARYNGGMLWYAEDNPSSVATTGGTRQSSLNSIYNAFALGLQTPELTLGASRTFGGWIGVFGGLTTYLTTSRDYGECIDCSTYFSMKGGFFAEPTVVFFAKVGDDHDKSFAIRAFRLSCSYSFFESGSDFGNVLSVALGYDMW